MHGRTLVEMAIVRVCQLDELDDLAALVAELRGTAPAGQPRAAADAKKNDELRGGALLDAMARVERRSDPPHTAHDQTSEPPGLSRRDEPAGSPGADEINTAAPAADSVLAQWQRAMAENNNQSRPAGPARPSRREQLASVAEQPFVRRALELFDVPPEKLRYTPPDDANGTG
jgi:hypothetical protein